MNSRNDKYTYGIVDDDTNFRNTLAGMLRLRLDTARVLDFSCAEDLLAYPYLNDIEFLIVDFRLPKMDGITLLGKPIIKDLAVPKLVLSGFDAEKKIFEALKNGATGYMFKEELYSLDTILETLLQGGAFITPTLALRVVSFFKDIKKTNEDFQDLTEREIQILEGLSSGYSPKEISESLILSIFTIRGHIKNIYKKLEVNSQVQLLKKAKEKNLL